MDKESLRPALRELVDYLKLSLRGVPDDVVILITLFQLSRISMMHRQTVENEGTIHPVCVYGINFMPSGTGKDKTIAVVNNLLMKPYFDNFERLEKEYRDRVYKDLFSEAKEKFSDNSNKIDKYIADNMPRRLADSFFDATMEGFIAQRETYEGAGFGGTSIIISEFSDYILNDSSIREQMLSLVKEVYEEGNSGAKITKYQKVTKPVKGVPSSVLFQSSPNGLMDEAGSKKILDFLSRGLARRALICYPEIEELPPIDYGTHLINLAKIERQKEDMQKIISRMVYAKDTFMGNNDFVFKFDERASKRLFQYTQICSAYKFNRFEAIQAEISSRPRKAEKLAGLIALIEHPSSHIIGVNDVESAITIVSHFGRYIQRFINDSFTDEVEKLYKHFITNIGRLQSRMDLRKLKLVHKAQFSNWIEGAIEEVKWLALADGYELLVRRKGSIGNNYLLINKRS
jgi:hypothetical protein